MITNCVARVRFVIPVSLLFAALVSVPAHGATYYVATSGSDANPGTEARPWRTIQKAAVTLIAGDTVYVKAGTYNEKVIPQNSGNPGNYITYAAYPGDTVTLDGTNITPDWGDALFTIEGKSYIKISGFRIVNSLSPYSSGGISLKKGSQQDHIIIENNYFHNITGPAIGGYSCENLIIDNNEITEVNVGQGPGSRGSGEAISLTDIHTFEIKNNHIHHTYKEGIDPKESSNGKIYKNHIHDIARIGIYLDAWNGPEHDIDIYQNVVHDNGDHGISLAIEQEGGSLKNISIYNNIVYNNGTGGIVISSYHFPTPRENIKIVNNVCYNNKHGIGIADVLVEDSIIRNNICSNNQVYQIASDSPSMLTIDHNLINGSTQIYGDDAIIGDPKFVNPSEADFHLQKDSPAIDSGSAIDAPSEDFAGIPRPQGAGYDIGAFEFIENGIDVPSNGKSLIIYLFQNYPNPFNTITNIKYLIARTAHVELKVYTLSGQLVKTLVDREQDLGSHVVEWDGRNDEGKKVSSGIYLYCLKTAGYTRVKKCAVSK